MLMENETFNSFTKDVLKQLKHSHPKSTTYGKCAKFFTKLNWESGEAKGV